MELIPLPQDPLGNLGMFLIPSLILGTYLAASTMRMTRTMMLEVLRQDYIRTAWAKGLHLVVVRPGPQQLPYPRRLRVHPAHQGAPVTERSGRSA